MIDIIPAIKKINITNNITLVLLGAPLNSRHINTPKRAATRVAPCPNPIDPAKVF